jgi:hypothetical protein
MNDSIDLELSIKAIINDSLPEASVDPNIKADDLAKLACIICAEELTDSDVSAACLNMKCRNQYCKSCLHRSIQFILNEAPYHISTIKCCLCLQRIPSSRWQSDLASVEASDDLTLANRYASNIGSILQIRCVNCDTNCNFFEESCELYSHGSPKQLNDIRDVFVIRERLRARNGVVKTYHIMAVYSISTVENIIIAWGKMLRSEISTREFVNCVVDNIVADVNDASKEGIALHMDDASIDSFNKALDEGSTPKIISNTLAKLKNMTCDYEMRAKLQLSTMQRFPRIFTTCCNFPHCFNCQRSGHHLGRTCREIQQKYTPDAQYCPECQVPVIKIDGCNSIRCVCGCEWDWETDPEQEYEENDEYNSVSPYMVNDSIVDEEEEKEDASPISLCYEECVQYEELIKKKLQAIDQLLHRCREHEQ